MYLLSLVLISYIVGSIPFGYLVCRAITGEDVRSLGSGNIGATNVLRSVGYIPALITLAADMLKGAAVILIGRSLGLSDIQLVIAALVTIAGHNWSIFLRFKGGKGMATTAGIIIALMPLVAVVAIAIFVIVLAITRYVSLASMIMAGSLPIISLIFGMPAAYTIFGLLAAGSAILRHRSNIGRLARKQEYKFGVMLKDGIRKNDRSKNGRVK